jgi:hypothetical protein
MPVTARLSKALYDQLGEQTGFVAPRPILGTE